MWLRNNTSILENMLQKIQQKNRCKNFWRSGTIFYIYQLQQESHPLGSSTHVSHPRF